MPFLSVLPIIFFLVPGTIGITTYRAALL